MTERTIQREKVKEPGRPVQPGVQAQRRIEDHALIGNLRSAALVTKDGTIDWLCLPDFDSDACFASLLGTPANGEWSIAPKEPTRKVERRYRKDTLILETDFTCDSGVVRLIDFMPVHQEFPRLVRTIVGLKGKVAVHSELTPRFAFGRSVPRVESADGALRAFAGPDALFLRRSDRDSAPPLVSDVQVSEGQRISWVLSWNYSWLDQAPPRLDADEAERDTEHFWIGWVSKIIPPPRYRDAVVRSLITIKACTYESTGGIVAAPTTSLPETPGGERNWDYRFTWLRDAVLARQRVDARGLEGRGGVLQEVGDARDRGRSRADADHVRNPRRAPPHGSRARLARRLRRREAGAHRKRGLRSVPARRARRGVRGGLRGREVLRRGRPRRAARAAQRRRADDEGLEESRQGHLGDARAGPSLHRLQGGRVDGDRPGDQGRGRDEADGPDGAAARDTGGDLRRGLHPRGSIPS